MSTLAGKVAIVTGASRGIGRAIAMKLAQEGASVMLAARDAALLESAVREIEATGGLAASAAIDLRQPESPGLLVEKTLAAFGGIDIIVNNAGATKRGEFLTLTDEDWLDGFALKFFGAVRLVRAAWPTLKERQGSVLNIAGIGGRTPGAQFTIGGSVNAAVLSFTKALADVGVRDGVQVNAVNPGPVRTDRQTVGLQKRATAEGISVEAAEAKMVAEAAITRMGEPEDVANLVAYIVSAPSRLLHGAVIDLDGGATKSF